MSVRARGIAARGTIEFITMQVAASAIRAWSRMMLQRFCESELVVFLAMNK